MLYAGGTDALVRLRAGMIDPPALICLERIQELKEIREEAGGLWVGAGASFHQVETSFLVGRSWPLLALAAGVGWFAPYPPHGAPWGGNLGTASPAGDALPALYALGGQRATGLFPGPAQAADGGIHHRPGPYRPGAG